MSDSARVPAVGDSIQLYGLERVILRIDAARNKVWFGNPATHPARDHGSREGACALNELQLVETGNGVVLWALPGARDAKTARPGAIQLGAAVFDINAKGAGGGGN